MNFIGWLAVFVFGSLIVSFLIYPQTFTSFTQNIKSILNKAGNLPANTNTTRIVPSQMEEYAPYGAFLQSCASIEARGEMQGIADFTQKVCREACGKRNMDYYTNDCEKDLLVCYCSG